MPQTGTVKGKSVELVMESGESDLMARKAQWSTRRKNIRPRPILRSKGKTVLAKESRTRVLTATIRHKEGLYIYELCLQEVLLVPAVQVNLFSCQSCAEKISTYTLAVEPPTP